MPASAVGQKTWQTLRRNLHLNLILPSFTKQDGWLAAVHWRILWIKLSYLACMVNWSLRF